MVTLIVEGWSDHDRIRLAYDEDKVKTVVLNGTKFNNSIRAQIEKAREEGAVYVLTDPDEAGDNIAKTIIDYYGLPRILVDPMRARFLRIGKGYKYGIEYCSRSYLQELLEVYVA